MRVGRRALGVALTLFATAMRPSTARADDTSDIQALLNETVITTASKSAERGSTAPATSTLLTAEDMRRYGIHSIAEAIDFLSLGMVTSSSLRTADVGARGVLIPRDQGDHFLMLVDGHAVNEALYGAARFDRGAGIPMELIDHIEVTLGPGSVLYGSNAMLGVVNIVTKRAREFAGTHVVAETEILKSWRVAAGAGYEPRFFGTKSELALELEYYRQDGPAFTFGEQSLGHDWTTGQPWPLGPNGRTDGVWGGKATHSYYSAVPSGQLSFRYKNLQLTLHGSTYKRSTPSNNGFVTVETDFDDPNNFELDRSAWADLKDEEQLSPVLRLTTRLYGDTFDYQRNMLVSSQAECIAANVRRCNFRNIGVSRWGGAEIQTSWDWLSNGTFVTLLGADGRLRFVSSASDKLNAETDQAAGPTRGFFRDKDQILGAYLQQTWQPANWFSMNAGARLDFDQRFGQRASPRAAISLGAWQGATLKAIYSEAFRAPSWQESAGAGYFFLPSHDLKPETVRSAEVVLDQTLGSHHLLFSAFRSWWKDLVEPHVLTVDEVFAAQLRGEIDIVSSNYSNSVYQNVSSTDNYGFNAGYDGAFAESRLRYAVNVTGSIARRSEPGARVEPLIVTPQVFGNARISYAPPGDWPTIAVAAHYLAKRPSDRAFALDDPLFAPPQLELRGTLSGDIPWIKGLSYRASVNYAFASHGAYVVGPIQGANSNRGGPTEPFVGDPQLVPVDQFRVTTGLEYTFGGGK
jgi:outer membrane receptor for ferrienterochelin and colicins